MTPVLEDQLSKIWSFPIKTEVKWVLGICVCVCPTLDKGSHPTTFTQAGDGDTCIASPSTKLAIHGEDISSGRGTDVPAFNTMTPLVHPAAVPWFHGFSSRYFPQTGFPQPPFSCRPPLVRCCRESADVHKLFVETPSSDRTPHLTVEPFLSLGN